MSIHKQKKPYRDPDQTLEVLFEISSAVSRVNHLDELFNVIHQSLAGILNVDNFYIAIFHPERDSITFPYHVDEIDEDPEEIFNFSSVTSPTGMVIHQQKPLIFYEDDLKALSEGFDPYPLGTVCKIWLGAPLTVRNRVIGAIAIQSYQSADAYDIKDLDLLNSVSQHIALAIDRKESDEKLTAQSRLLEKILEASPVGIALLENRVFKWVNNEMVRLFGYEKKSDFENKSARIIYSSIEDYDLSGKILYASLATNGTADYEINLIKKDQQIFSAQIRMNCADTSDPMARTIAIFTDISRGKAAEKERFERERLQGILEMAGAVCHELNQPLQAILGYSELIIMNPEHDSSDRNLHSIKLQAAKIENITRKLSGITHYKTVKYAGDTMIVDIWNADH